MDSRNSESCKIIIEIHLFSLGFFIYLLKYTLSISYCRYPCKQTIRILLQCGANVNATNIVRNTPLHIFASNSNDCDESILQLLCDANVHFDYGNDLKQTPLDMAFNLNTRQLLKTKFKQNLKCLCARIIQRHNISYHGKIVKSLINFVEQH